jgi:hypothetical protein
MDLKTVFLAATLVFFIMGLIAAMEKAPFISILLFVVSLGSYIALENTANPSDGIVLEDVQRKDLPN